MKQKLIIDIPGIRELERHELKDLEGGLGTLGIILAVAGIYGGALAYKGFCDSVNKMGQKLGAALAR